MRAWYIAEFEDNQVRDKLLTEAKRYPFDVSVRDPENGQCPTKKDLFGYLEEVRILYRQRLEPLDTADFGRQIADEHFGKLTV